jgi:hypothetical protein
VLAISVVLLGLGVMWFYAFFLAPNRNPDTFPDRAWAARAQSICTRYAAQIAALPPARSFRNVQPKSEALRQRADVGEQATNDLRAMVAELKQQAPADAVTQKGVSLWYGDWDLYLASRDRQVAKWRQGLDEPFAETAVSGKKVGTGVPVSIRMDGFSDENSMAACEVPQDIG